MKRQKGKEMASGQQRDVSGAAAVPAETAPRFYWDAAGTGEHRGVDKEAQDVVASANSMRHQKKEWAAHPEAKPEKQRPVGSLTVGARFRSDNLDGTWTYGTLTETRGEPVMRARVRLDGNQRQVIFGDGEQRREFEASGASTVNWPWTVPVEQVGEQDNVRADDPGERRWTMNQEAQEKAVRARYAHQLRQMEAAQANGDAAKVEMVGKKLDQIGQEAETLGITLADPQPVPAELTAADLKPTAERGRGREPKEAQGKKLKAANEERLTALKQKKDGKPKAERKVKLDATRDCLCGCGRETGGLFAPGHDARVKGLLLKIERGEEPKSALDGLPVAAWVKWAGKSATAGKEGSDFRLMAAPVKIPQREDVSLATVS